jgi:hypothetical protein
MALSFIYLGFTRILQLVRLSRRDNNELEIEVVMLRHEVAVLRRQVVQPALRPSDRALLAGLARLLGRRRGSRYFVQPKTLRRWHQDLIRRGTVALRANDAEPASIGAMAKRQSRGAHAFTMHLNTRSSAHLMLRVGSRGSMQQCLFSAELHQVISRCDRLFNPRADGDDLAYQPTMRELVGNESKDERGEHVVSVIHARTVGVPRGGSSPCSALFVTVYCGPGGWYADGTGPPYGPSHGHTHVEKPRNETHCIGEGHCCIEGERR